MPRAIALRASVKALTAQMGLAALLVNACSGAEEVDLGDKGPVIDKVNIPQSVALDDSGCARADGTIEFHDDDGIVDTIFIVVHTPETLNYSFPFAPSSPGPLVLLLCKRGPIEVDVQLADDQGQRSTTNSLLIHVN